MTRTAYITCIKDEADIIYPNLEHHYLLGIRHFIIMHNNSDPWTREIVRSFSYRHSKAMFLVLDDNRTAYLQPERFTRMAEIAHDKLRAEWIIPVDADELVVPPGPGPLNDYLPAGHDFGYIRCAWHDYVPSEDLPGGVCPLIYWENRKVKPRDPSKIIVKWKNGMKFGDGHHLITTYRKEIENPGIFYAHYPHRSREFFRRKIETIGKAFIQTFGKDSNRPQVQQYLQLQSEGDVYFETIWQDILRRRRSDPNEHIPVWRHIEQGRCNLWAIPVGVCRICTSYRPDTGPGILMYHCSNCWYFSDRMYKYDPLDKPKID